MSPENKVKLEKYLKGYVWLKLKKDASESDVKKVNERLGLVEDELRQVGVTQETFTRILALADEIATTPIDKLPEKRQLFLGRIIFGEKYKDRITKWDEKNPNVDKI